MMSLLARRSLLVGLIAVLLGGLFWQLNVRPSAKPAESIRVGSHNSARRAVGLAGSSEGGVTSTTPGGPSPEPAATNALDYAGVTLPSRIILIASETQGRITQVLARTGQAVRQGQIFARTDTYLKQLAVAAAEAQVTQVRSQLAQAHRQVERLRALAAERNASMQELDNAQTQLTQLDAQHTAAQVQWQQAQRQLADATVRIPATGILTERTVEPGAVLQPGSDLGKIVDVSTLKVRIDVPEQEVFRLRLGQTARCQPDALPGLLLTGRITHIGVVADAVRNFPVELTLANPNGRLKAGQSINVSF